ncbi:SDR family NAD(P)-dependent oxidoreductase [Paraburkholderia sabiae]|jgi:NAD(P)-dependent dehydrogenase (short-subunit alcohol dehydrogenase family)|uniref:SDR family oxidoreductase n=1 Tax=Paraburkholderia sabiae TaxID=273251 RepID=A0ABU9Q6H7_9BURK|nr:SDR family oxidoreductase [Paraburkholderia sabiae]WJZ78009.1 SDR family oxidoreductase [Paraburkholderia sabiae]CAD6530020.1 2-(R)-hydroxypropyl-CoM dehydrogenase [Paraburkholderia sabiae]
MFEGFENRSAVVTGASSGIGLATVQRLLENGARVLAMSRTMRELESLQATHGERLKWLKGDVTESADLAALAERARQFGAIDFLLPNAGIAQLGDGLESAAFERQWAVNGAGALNTLSVLRDQLAKPASVVFIGTFLSQVTFPGLAAYIASKTALKAHARTLAVELATDDVRINIVSPGPTATAIWSTLGLSQDQLSAVAGRVNQRLLSGRFLEPSAIADTIMFLLSPASRGIYGQDVIVDNGYTLQ